LVTFNVADFPDLATGPRSLAIIVGVDYSEFGPFLRTLEMR